MDFIADFHIHSRYSRATSASCNPEQLDFWARRKGVDLLGTGDFTHALWRKELAEKLTQCAGGLYALAPRYRIASDRQDREVRFIVSGEISSIYKKNGRTRKVHNLIVLPDLQSAGKLSARLEAIGNLHSDGRPILGLDSKVLLDMTLSVCPNALFIPAHIWTPHFSVLGASSGFDDIEECFEDLTGHIFAVETGLSSDPPMNWRLSQLDRFALVSNSDAHSPANLAREANIFSTVLSYDSLYAALKTNDRAAFAGTLEFFPEEGKYHFDGHRACKVQWEPSRTIAAAGICPVCGGKLTVGVLHRVEELADRPQDYMAPCARRFERIVPLAQVVGASIGSSAASLKVTQRVNDLVSALGPELTVLRTASIDDIKAAGGELIAEGIRRVRAGQLHISAGYDGEYGVVEIFTPQERSSFIGQTALWEQTGKKTIAKKKVDAISATVKKNEKNQSSRESRDGEGFPYGLNGPQWEAVSSSAQAIMVAAGPGTGKTHTLISRIAYLVNERGVMPSDITAVTFTNKAAQEMRQRLSPLFRGHKDRSMPRIGTFHTICLDCLRQWEPQRPLAVTDRAAAMEILRDVMQGQGRPADTLRLISRAKAGGPLALAALAPEVASHLSRYQAQLSLYNAVDFDDILLEALLAFEKNTGSVARTGDCFRHILVDEFQDINEVQYMLIEQWAKPCESLFVIGDPNQSIYGFRGASPRYFEQFTQDHPGAAVVTLTRNYRSPPSVVTAARLVIGQAAQSVEVMSSGVHPVRLVETKDEFSEAVFIAKEINRQVGGVDMLDAHVLSGGLRGKAAGVRGFCDIAVLYRTHRQSAIIERCLIREGIQYRVAGEDDFLSDDAVRYAIAFFKFLLNPDDVFAFLLCCKHLRMADASAAAALYASGVREHARLSGIAREAGLKAADSEKLAAFEARLLRCAVALQSENHRTVVESWVRENETGEGAPLQRLVQYVEAYPDLASFLRALTIGREADIVRNGTKTVSPDAVLLTTMHAAKGLEFPVVFISGVNEGIVPLRGVAGRETDIEEERRLFYVGLTRAKEELICTFSRKRTVMGVLADAAPSCFIRDMGEKNIVREKYRPEPTVEQMSFL